MKNIRLSICAVSVFFLSLNSCVTPAEYCEDVMEDCSRLNQSVKVLSAKISSKDLDAIQSIYDRNLTQIDSTIEALQKKGAYQDSSYLINAALNFAQTYKSIYENEYVKCIEILKKEKKTYEDGDTIAFMSADLSEKSLKVQNELLKNCNKFIKDFGLGVASPRD